MSAFGVRWRTFEAASTGANPLPAGTTAADLSSGSFQGTFIGAALRVLATDTYVWSQPAPADSPGGEWGDVLFNSLSLQAAVEDYHRHTFTLDFLAVNAGSARLEVAAVSLSSNRVKFLNTWSMEGWDSCEGDCGEQGTQSMVEPQCLSGLTGAPLPDSMCEPALELAQTRPCTIAPCSTVPV